MHRSAALALALLSCRLAAAADRLILLPPDDAPDVPAVAAAFEAAGVPLGRLGPEQLVAAPIEVTITPLAVLVGAAYCDTVATPGDAAAALGRYVEDGGTLLVLADGPAFLRASSADGTLRFGLAPFPIARLFGLQRAGEVVRAEAARVRGTGEIRLPEDALADTRLPAELPVLGACPPGWRLTPWLVIDGPRPHCLLGLLSRADGAPGRVVYGWSGLFRGPLATPLAGALARRLAPSAAEVGPTPPSPLQLRVAALRDTINGAMATAEGDRAHRLSELMDALRAVEIGLPQAGEALTQRLANLEAVTALLLAATPENHPVIELTTNRGTFQVELLPEVAPRHVANLLKLAGEGFYDGLHFHRVVPGFVVQVGCPHTRESATDPRAGTGGPGWSVPAEFNATPHLRGTLGMARSADPNSAGSQFYICLGDAPHLDRQYTVFGRVVGEAMAVVDQIRVGDVLETVRIVDEAGAADE